MRASTEEEDLSAAQTVLSLSVPFSKDAYSKDFGLYCVLWLVLQLCIQWLILHAVLYCAAVIIGCTEGLVSYRLLT